MLQPTIVPLPARPPSVLEACFSNVLRMLPRRHGAHRLLARVQPTAWQVAAPLVDIPYRGHVIRMDVSDLVGWRFLMLRSCDPAALEVIRRFSAGAAGDVFWDVGASKGACCFAVATALPQARIVAIEPQQGLQELLQMNLAAVAPGRHVLLPVGIGESTGVFDIVIPRGNHGAASLVPGRRSAGDRVEMVQVTTAATAQRLSGFGWPTVVKVDVEGFEPAVIRSLEPAFAGGHVRCCVFTCRATQATGFAAIHACTSRHGYRLHAIRETAFATTLVPVAALAAGASGYAIVRSDLGADAAARRPARLPPVAPPAVG